MLLKEKECEVCGAWFTPTRPNGKYCPDCRRHPEQKLRKIESHTQRNIRLYGTGRKPEKVQCTCDYCGKEFFTYGKKKDFCSADCTSKYRIAHTVCAYCKKPMTETDNVYDDMGKTWYCSDECREKAAWVLARTMGTVKKCPNCGKEHIKDGTYCSKECYLEYIRKQKEHTQYLLANGLKECPVCKKEYSGNGKFCSAECEQKQKASEPHAMRVCEVCGKKFSCPVSDMIHPLCSDNCRSIFRDNVKKEKELKKTAFHVKQQEKHLSKEEKYIEENGLCSICRTSYKDCERLQSNFTASPKGSVFSGSIVVKCPKFRK